MLNSHTDRRPLPTSGTSGVGDLFSDIDGMAVDPVAGLPTGTAIVGGE